MMMLTVRCLLRIQIRLAHVHFSRRQVCHLQLSRAWSGVAVMPKLYAPDDSCPEVTYLFFEEAGVPPRAVQSLERCCSYAEALGSG